jgi:hypothetical protein
MRYLEKFYNYIKESKDINKSEVEEMLLSIKDLGFIYTLQEGTLVGVNPDDKNHGKKYLSVNIPLDKLKTSNLITTYTAEHIDDSSFWELLDEILSLRGRMLDTGLTNCVIDFSNKRGNYNPYISLLLIGDKDDTDKGRMNLIEFEKRITSKLNSMRSDFSYGTYCILRDDHILVKSDEYSYTHRKFNNLLSRSLEGSDLSLSDFNIDKSRDAGTYTQDWLIKITTKE